MEPYYTQAEQLYQVHGARGEDPTEPPASAPYPFPAVSHEPRIQQLADDLAAAGHHPFHAPCGVMLNEADMAAQRLRALLRPATASPASCTPSPTPRCSPCGRRSSTRTSRCCERAGRGAAHQPGGHGRDRGRGRARRRPGDLQRGHRRRVLRRGQLGQAAARLGHREASRTASPTGPTSSGATTRSTTARPCSPCPRRRTRRSSRRRSASTTSTSAATTSSSRWATSRWSASRRRRCSAARSRSRPSWRPRARSRALPATRSTSGSPPRTCRGPRTA